MHCKMIEATGYELTKESCCRIQQYRSESWRRDVTVMLQPYLRIILIDDYYFLYPQTLQEVTLIASCYQMWWV